MIKCWYLYDKLLSYRASFAGYIVLCKYICKRICNLYLRYDNLNTPARLFQLDPAKFSVSTTHGRRISTRQSQEKNEIRKSDLSDFEVQNQKSAVCRPTLLQRQSTKFSSLKYLARYLNLAMNLLYLLGTKFSKLQVF